MSYLILDSNISSLFWRKLHSLQTVPVNSVKGICTMWVKNKLWNKVFKSLISLNNVSGFQSIRLTLLLLSLFLSILIIDVTINGIICLISFSNFSLQLCRNAVDIVTVSISWLILITGRSEGKARHHKHGHLGSCARKLQSHTPPGTSSPFPQIAGGRCPAKGRMGIWAVKSGWRREDACLSGEPGEPWGG